jgi:hypothetical protein
MSNSDIFQQSVSDICNDKSNNNEDTIEMKVEDLVPEGKEKVDIIEVNHSLINDNGNDNINNNNVLSSSENEITEGNETESNKIQIRGGRRSKRDADGNKIQLLPHPHHSSCRNDSDIEHGRLLLQQGVTR